MSAAERVAAIYGALNDLGLHCLVMGGHAVRYYGVERNTVDYDFHVSMDAEGWSSLRDRLARARLFSASPLLEGPSWRPGDFRRFVIGILPSGQEERVDFWRRNHLLAPFEELYGRREEGLYGGGVIAFLGLDDLIRSKETEREDDWRDVLLLEEIADARRLARARDEASRIEALSRLRSRRGLERAEAEGLLAPPERATSALRAASHPVTLALLLPYARPSPLPGGVSLDPRIGPILDGALRQVEPGSARHLALVEAERRLYKQAAMAADRADKERAVTEGRRTGS